MPANDAHAKVATAILKQIPLSQVGSFLNKLSPQNVEDGDKGHGCGLGCSHPSGLDQFAHSSLTAAELKGALTDKAGLSAAIKAQAASLAKGMGG